MNICFIICDRKVTFKLIEVILLSAIGLEMFYGSEC